MYLIQIVELEENKEFLVKHIEEQRTLLKKDCGVKAFKTSSIIKSYKDHCSKNWRSEREFQLQIEAMSVSRPIKLYKNFPLVGRFYGDFVCIEEKVVVEIDGNSHFREKQIKFDKRRDGLIEHAGFKIIRIRYPGFLNIEQFLKWADASYVKEPEKHDPFKPLTVTIKGPRKYRGLSKKEKKLAKQAKREAQKAKSGTGKKFWRKSSRIGPLPFKPKAILRKPM